MAIREAGPDDFTEIQAVCLRNGIAPPGTGCAADTDAHERFLRLWRDYPDDFSDVPIGWVIEGQVDPVDVEWTVRGEVLSSIDEGVTDLELTIFVDPL